MSFISTLLALSPEDVVLPYIYMRKCKTIKLLVNTLHKKVAPAAAFIAQPLMQALTDIFQRYKVTVSCLSLAFPVLVFV